MRKEKQDEKNHNNRNMLPHIVDCLLADSEDPHLLIKLGQKADNLGKKLIGETHIFYGQASVGKAGMIYWAANQEQKMRVIKVDCSYNKSENAFIEELTSEMRYILKNKEEEVTKKMVINDEIRFSELNPFIKKSKLNFVFLIKNTERLADMKKQIILYNLLEWMKTQIRDYIGLVFSARSVLFIEKLQKRIKSRLSAKSVFIPPPKSETVKLILLRRFEVLKESLKLTEDKKLIQKIIESIKHGKQIDKIIKKSSERVPKNITFFLELFKLLFVLAFSHDHSEMYQLSSSELQKSICEQYQSALLGIHPNLKKNQSFLQNANYPQYIVMGIIKWMMECEKGTISPKQINNQYKEMKKQYITVQGFGSSFNYSENFINSAIKKLQKLKLLTLTNQGFDNADVISHMTPEEIRVAIQNIEHIPEILKNILKH